MSSSILVFLFLFFANSIFTSEVESDVAETQLDEYVYEYDSDDGVFLVADFDENDNQLDELIFDDEDNWTVTDMLQDIRENFDFRFRKYIQAGLHLECPCMDVESGFVYDPLWFAVRQKSYAWIEKLLQTGHFDVNSFHEGTSMYLIDLAVSMKDLKAIEILIMNGADPNLVDSQGHTALMKSLKTWDPSVFKRLLKFMDYVSVSVCFEALEVNNIRAFSLILDSRKIRDINGTDESGETILRRGIRNDLSCRMLQKLLSYPGLDINMVSDGCGSTALHAAVEKGHATIVKIILQNRARVDIKNDLGLTVRHTGLRRGHYLGAPFIMSEVKARLFGSWFRRAARNHYLFNAYLLLQRRNHEAENDNLSNLPKEILNNMFELLIQSEQQKKPFDFSFGHELYEFDKLSYAKEILEASTGQGLISLNNSEILEIALSEIGFHSDLFWRSPYAAKIITSKLDSFIAKIDIKDEDEDEIMNFVEDIRFALEN